MYSSKSTYAYEKFSFDATVFKKNSYVLRFIRNLDGESRAHDEWKRLRTNLTKILSPRIEYSGQLFNWKRETNGELSARIRRNFTRDSQRLKLTFFDERTQMQTRFQPLLLVETSTASQREISFLYRPSSRRL